ncbi:MAG: hypothetical protein ABJF04_09175 [Reichenbachiella sp.]|uniref:hypothetical protein n=1 Tax=Reichenbachiella sp. TaxID=2184521 RepID=UPI003265E733
MQVSESNQKWIAIGVAIGTTSIAIVSLIAFSVNVLQEYGAVLFTLVPLALGVLSTSIYGYFRPRSLKESARISFYTLLLACGILILFNIEGIVCVLMAAPFAAVFVFMGTWIGYKVQKRDKGQVIKFFSFNLLVIPILMVAESECFEREGGEIEVKTSIVINASKETVWDNVVKFPDIPAPTEWIFKTGIAYPTSSEIIGSGKGAVRYCEFTTGSFVEPIEIWDEPNLLQFSVREQPIPLRRMIHEKTNVPGNMYKYFVSNKGQFRLTELGKNEVLLEGTTWYYHKIKPVVYWKIWSEYIIHSIHNRVLTHIKAVSENA